MRCAWGLLVLLGACVSSDALECSDGQLCPAGTACDPMHGGCVQPSQLTTCDGIADGMSCGIDSDADGICDLGVCIVERCGDGYIRGGEECDGDQVPDDANCTDLGFYMSQKPTCTADCTLDRTSCAQECGDGVLQPQYEICETDTPVTASCVDYGFGAGQLGCINCGPETSACIPFGWQLESITASVNAMSATSGTDVWATTNALGSPLAHYNGTSWSPADLTACALPSGTQLDQVFAVSPDLVFFSGPQTIWRLSAGACTSYPLADNVYAIWAVSANDAWVSVENSGIYHFDGSTWMLSHAQADFGDAVTHLWGTGPSDVYAITNAAGMLHWSGSSWSPFTAGTLELAASVWGSGPSDLYVGGRTSNEAAIVHWNGASWSDALAGFGLLTGDAAVYAGQMQGGRQYVEAFTLSPYRFFLLYNDGTGWVDLDAPINSGVPFAGTSDGSVFAWIGNTSKVAHLDGSIRIDRGEAPGTNDITQIAGDRIDNLFASTYSGKLYRYDGASWTLDESIVANDLSRSPSGTLFAVSSTQIAKRLSNGTWQTNSAVGGNQISVVSDTDAWILEGQSTLRHWHAGTVDSFDVPGEINDMWAASSTSVFLAGQDGNGAAILQFDGATFTPMTLPANNESQILWMTVNSATDMYAIGSFGKLMHYDGNAWSYQDTPPQTIAVYGTPNDLFVGTYSDLEHFDGTSWNPVASGSPTGATRLFGMGDTMYFFDYYNRMHTLVRMKPW